MTDEKQDEREREREAAEAAKRERAKASADKAWPPSTMETKVPRQTGAK